MEKSELFSGGPVFAKSGGVFAPGTDAVVLADFADVKYFKNICDIGCGCGVLAIVAAERSPSSSITAVDIDPEACACTEENAKANGLSGQISVMCADIRLHRDIFKPGEFDCVISNPPYFPPDSGKHSKVWGTARQEINLNLTGLAEAVSYILKYGGTFYLVHRADRAAEVITCLSNSGLEPKEMRFVQHTAGSSPSLILIKCKKGGKPGVLVPPPLILANGDGSRSDEVLRIYGKKWRD